MVRIREEEWRDYKDDILQRTDSSRRDKIFSLQHSRQATKVVKIFGSHKEAIIVGIIRERLFGPDTIEEALKVVDNVSLTVPNKPGFSVVAGINDMEHKLISASIDSRRRSEARFMSPLVKMCVQNSIPLKHIGRNLVTTSSRLSQACLRHPYEFYSLLWVLATKRITIMRTPQAKSFLMQKIPSIASVYIDEGSIYMGTRIVQEINQSTDDRLVAVVPMENFASVVDLVGRLDSSGSEDVISDIDKECMGVWLPVFIIYILLPCAIVYKSVSHMLTSHVSELSNYETQGVALGTWVRDLRRD